MLEWPDVSLNGWRAKLQNWCLVDRCHGGVLCSQTSPLPLCFSTLSEDAGHRFIRFSKIFRLEGWQRWDDKIKSSKDLWSFEWCFHWKFYLNAQVLFMIFSANNLLCCFLNQSFKDLCTTTLRTHSCKVIPPGRMTKSVLNIFVLFLYWFCQVISVSIPNQLAEVISGLLVFPK